jgi:hypothetical protein
MTIRDRAKELYLALKPTRPLGWLALAAVAFVVVAGLYLAGEGALSRWRDRRTDAAIAERDARIQDLERAVAERDGRLAANADQMTAKDAELAEKDAIIADLAAKGKQQDATVTDTGTRYRDARSGARPSPRRTDADRDRDLTDLYGQPAP